MKAVITVTGNDRKGIIAAVSAALLEVDINILDISQTTMQEIFTMIMLVDISECSLDFSVLANTLETLGKNIGMVINVQHEDIFNSMHRV